MAYADLASNQAVSFNNLANAVNTGVFLRKQAIPATNECITKDDALAYAYLNATYMSGKSSNQLVEKTNLIQESGIYYMIRLGIYPVMGAGYQDGYISLRNNSAGTIYVYAFYNSGEIDGGTASGYIELEGPPEISTGTEPILINAAITSENQSIYSTSYYAIPATYTADIGIVKDDLLEADSFLRLAYSTTIGGTKITL